jgi:hypothetical protein
MMKFFIFLSFLLISNCFIAQTDCSTFKTGTFYYETLPGKLSVRSEKLQKSYSNGKLEMVWRINWTDSCTYVMTLKKMRSKDYPWFHIGDRIVITITSTMQSCYIYQSRFYAKKSTEFIESIGEMCLLEIQSAP